jgi:hypothetical protein
MRPECSRWPFFSPRSPLSLASPRGAGGRRFLAFSLPPPSPARSLPWWPLPVLVGLGAGLVALGGSLLVVGRVVWAAPSSEEEE